MGKAIILSLFFWGVTAGAAEPFSLEPYLKQCGGKIYAKCNAADLNQKTIFADALKVAVDSGRDMMVVFGADWCPACASFAKMLATDPSRSRLHDRFVVVEINGDLSTGREVSKQLGMARSAYPQAFIVEAKTQAVRQQFFPTMYASLEELMNNIGVEKKKSNETVVSLGSVQISTLERPIGVVSDYGTTAFIAGPTTESDLLVNQGVAALNVYQYVDAYRSFRTAEQKKTDHVLAIVGQIIAVLDVSSGYGFEGLTESALARIETISSKRVLTRVESAWVNFARALIAAKSTNIVYTAGKKPLSLTQTGNEVVAADPANHDAAALVAWYSVAERGMEDSRKMFQSVLAKNPNQVGAVHALLHLAEYENDHQSARSRGAHLAQLVPESAHANHMYGHTLPQQGLWKEASIAFEKADAIHHQWARRHGLDVNQDWHYSHNLDLLAASYLAQGDFNKAATTWKNAATDYRAVHHYLELLLVTKPKAEFAAELERYGAVGWPVADLRYELNLDLNAALPLDDGHGDGDTYNDLLKALVEAAKSGQKAASAALTDRVTSYFAKRFKAGGFDGWSNAYLEMLRLKRVAQILEVKNLADSLEPLEFAARSGSLCGTSGVNKTLVRCLPSP